MHEKKNKRGHKIIKKEEFYTYEEILTFLIPFFDTHTTCFDKLCPDSTHMHTKRRYISFELPSPCEPGRINKMGTLFSVDFK